jgi:hypothetical protein
MTNDRDFFPNANLEGELLTCGVPEQKARQWAALGRAQCAHLTWDNGSHLWEVHRGATKQLRLADWAGNSSAELRRLVAHELTRARSLGMAAVKAQLPLPALEGLGFEQMRQPDAEPHSPLGSIAWLQARPSRETPKYLQQRTVFTCGPASVIMGSHLESSLANEMDLWREANYGIGTDPYGLAAAAATRGISTHVFVSQPGLLLHEKEAGSFTEGNTRQAIHDANVAKAHQAGADITIGAFDLDDLRAAIASSSAVAILIDEELLNAEKGAHWILAWALAGDAVVVHDPWINDDVGETWVETATMPIEGETLWQMAAWGEDRVRALVALQSAS